ncbi:MAG: hypothetical protein JNJ46_27560 [Myxococcales bacterium]|nr:hypothetical protein [Myxococcales bacterium]
MLQFLTRVDAQLVRRHRLQQLDEVRAGQLCLSLGRLGVASAVWALPVLDAVLRRFRHSSVEILASPTVTALLRMHCEDLGHPCLPTENHSQSLHIRLLPGAGLPRYRQKGSVHQLSLRMRGGRALGFAPLDQPAAAALQDCAFMAGFDPDGSPPRLRLPKQLQAVARHRYRTLCAAAGGPLIALLPAHNPRHSYGAERLWDVGQRLAARIGGTVIQLGGPPSRGPAVARAAQDAGLAAALLHLCAVAISDDIGWAHVAAAVGAPVATVFTRNNPLRHGPVSRHSAVLWASSSRCPHAVNKVGPLCRDCVSVEEVFVAAERVAAESWPRDRLRAWGLPL